MHLHDIVLASPIANSNQRALSPQKFFIHIYHLLVLVTGWESYYDMCFLLYNPKKEKRSSQSMHTVTELGRNYHYPAPCIKLSLRAPFIQ